MKMQSHPGISIYISYHIEFDFQGAKQGGGIFIRYHIEYDFVKIGRGKRGHSKPIFSFFLLKKLMMIFIYKILKILVFFPINLLKYLYFIFINLGSLTTQIIISF